MRKYSNFLVLGLLTAACGKNAFQSGSTGELHGGDSASKSDSDSQENKGSANEPTQKELASAQSDEFSLKSQQSQIDVYWFIENSILSKIINNRTIKNNIDQFETTLKNEKDVQIKSVIVDDFAIGMLNRIFRTSRDELQTAGNPKYMFQFAASSLCEKNNPQNKKELSDICKKMEQPDDIITPTEKKSKNALASLVRPEARPVFIFIANHDVNNTVNTNAESFKKFLELKFPNYKPEVYSFIGKNSDCTWFSGGFWYSSEAQYEKLAKATGGKTFNLCSADWKESFDEIASGIKKIKDVRFKLTKKASAILKIEVDGKAISAEGYSIIGDTVVFKDGILRPEQSKIKIFYK